jgi:hypothetical protein
VTTDQRVVAKQEIQEVESAKRAGAPYAHHRNQAREANTKLRQQLANAPRARRYRDKRPENNTSLKIRTFTLKPTQLTRLDPNEDGQVRTYHRLVVLKQFSIFKFYFGVHIQFKLQLQLQHTFALKLKIESEDEIQNNILSSQTTFTQRGGNKFLA